MSMDFKQLQENWNEDKEQRKSGTENINGIYVTSLNDTLVTKFLQVLNIDIPEEEGGKPSTPGGMHSADPHRLTTCHGRQTILFSLCHRDSACVLGHQIYIHVGTADMPLVQ